MTNKIKIALISLLTLFVFSCIATFIIIEYKSLQKPKISTATNINVNEAMDKDIQDDEDQSSIDIDKIFDGVEEIYINNINNPSNTVEVIGKDKGFITINFKVLDKKKDEFNSLSRDILNLDDYVFQIDIPPKNIKVNLYKDRDYIYIQTKDGILKEIYRVEDHELKEFIEIVEEIYLDIQISKITDSIHENIYLRAKDENALYVMNKKEIKELFSKLHILSIENGDEFVGIAPVYPNYEVTIDKDESEYKLRILNDNILIVDTPIVYLYCKYDKKLWDYINDKFFLENKSDDEEFKYLLKSDKVIVTDIEGVYNFQNSSYYNREIPRLIIKENPVKISDDIVINEKMQFQIDFIIDNSEKTVAVYENYLIYQDKKYKANNIGEKIKSIIIAP